MDYREIKKLGTDEIDIEVGRLRRRLYDLRCQSVTEKIQETTQFGNVKRDVARLLTEKRAREIAVASAK